MNETKTRFKIGRKWILVILAAYLLVLAFFTFLSNKILNSSVPHVISFSIDGGEIGEESYEKVIPISAWSSDEQGNYVLEIVRRDTPLGERCYLNRVNVMVLETDYEKGRCAVSFSLSWGDEIVKECIPEYKDRDIVVVERMEE